MSVINRTALTTVLLAVAVVAVPGSAPAGASVAAHLSGRWQLNVQASDKPPALPAEDAKKQPGTQNNTTRKPGGGRSPEPFGGLYGDDGRGNTASSGPENAADQRQAATRAGYGLLDAPHELTIFEREPNVILTDEHGRVEIVRATGERSDEVLPDGVEIRRTASWQNGALVVRTEIDNGPLVVQTYSPSEDGTRMTVTSTLEPRAKKTKGKETPSAPVSVRSVYQNAAGPARTFTPSFGR